MRQEETSPLGSRSPQIKPKHCTYTPNFYSQKGSWELKILSHFFHTELEGRVYGE